MDTSKNRNKKLHKNIGNSGGIFPLFCHMFVSKNSVILRVSWTHKKNSQKKLQFNVIHNIKYCFDVLYLKNKELKKMVIVQKSVAIQKYNN